MLISQMLGSDGQVCVVARTGDEARVVNGAQSVLALANDAIANSQTLAERIDQLGLGAVADIEAAYAEGRMLAPITHPDPAHLHLAGTGLTHLGSAQTRDKMHAQDKPETDLTDSMKMFRMGLDGGKPSAGKAGVQPEWFYKGNGHALVAPGAPIPSPCFALDAGEEPEIAGIYVIASDGTPTRIGFALANEFSDHVTERQNYLYLAHSKLRHAAVGPEIFVGALPRDIRGTSKIVRDGETLWEKPFLSGEDNMSHTIANLEHHHFKYGIFRTPGDVHVHMFGTATLSFADGISTRTGDVFEISAPDFGLALKNSVVLDEATDPEALVAVASI